MTNIILDSDHLWIGLLKYQIPSLVMRHLSTAFLVFLIMTVTFRDGLVLLCFKMDQKYIEQNLCVERDLNESLCHGSCQLKLRISENHDLQENPFLILLNDQLPVHLFHQVSFPAALPEVSIKLLKLGASQIVYFSAYLYRHFRPPEA